MAEKQSAARKRSRSKSENQQSPERGEGGNGQEEEVTRYEEELAGYLHERIKPGLSSSAIPLMARSIAKELVHWEPDRAPEAEGEQSAEAEEEQTPESEDSPDFEAEMQDLQAELGEDWILRFSVQGDKGWLTAEKEDGSQRVEAPTASVLVETVELLNEGGGRSR